MALTRGDMALSRGVLALASGGFADAEACGNLLPHTTVYIYNIITARGCKGASITQRGFARTWLMFLTSDHGVSRYAFPTAPSAPAAARWSKDKSGIESEVSRALNSSSGNLKCAAVGTNSS